MTTEFAPETIVSNVTHMLDHGIAWAHMYAHTYECFYQACANFDEYTELLERTEKSYPVTSEEYAKHKALRGLVASTWMALDVVCMSPLAPNAKEIKRGLVVPCTRNTDWLEDFSPKALSCVITALAARK